jgi:hypothetical protein
MVTIISYEKIYLPVFCEKTLLCHLFWVLIKNPVKPRLHAVLLEGNIVAPSSGLCRLAEE